MKVAILGGSFDPPHVGHALTAQAVLTHCPDIERVYWTPCGQHAWGKDMADSAHRLRMVRDAIADLNDPRHQVFDHEVVHGLTGRTWDLARSVRATYPDLDFGFVIGMDNANRFAEWHEPEKLAAEFPFVVVAREGEAPDPKVDWYMRGHHRFVNVEKPLPKLGSRDIRPMIAGGRFAEAEMFLGRKVLGHIILNNLYRNK